jgi:hypothetical protein
VAKTKIDAVTFCGSSGKPYEFRVYLWDTKFKSLPGVYVIASRSIEPGASPRYEPLFIGATGDLSKIFKSHPRSDCFQMYYANVVGVLRVTEEAHREAIRRDLADTLAPPCNGAEAELA